MMNSRGLLAAGLMLWLSGCTVTQHAANSDFRPPEGNYTLLVMQPDIRVGVLTAGGAFEFREDWTEQAKQNVLKSLAAQQANRGGRTKVAATREDTGADPALVADLVWLHNAVGQAVRMHKFAPQPLPTKKDRFDWTLGRAAVEFGTTTQYDYALFLHAQDSFSSGGRVALQIAGMLGCGLGVCVMPMGGSQAAFASLVDLKTGQIVWFNTLGSSVGDIRTPEGADKMVMGLLDKMHPAKSKANRRT
jgi:hypothetical protein